MFSKNISKLSISPTLRLNQISLELEKKNKKIYKFGFGQSPFPVPEFLKENLKKYVHKKEYLPVEGLYDLRKSISNHYNKSYNLNLSSNNILIGPGSKELLFTLQMLCNRKTKIISPGWVSYANQCDLLGLKYDFLKTDIDNSFYPKEFKLGSSDMIIFNYPNNPTGQIINFKNYKNSLEETGCLLVSDEIYSYINFKNELPSTILEHLPNSIVSNGLSKWCGAGGWRLGYMIIPDLYIGIADKMTKLGSELYSCVNAPIQYAATDLFNNFNLMDDYLFKMNFCLSTLNNKIEDIFRESKIKFIKPEGGFYYFLDFSNYKDDLKKFDIVNDVDLCDNILEISGVALLAGSYFGRNINELTARLAFVDFDGRKIIENNNLTENDIIDICDNTIEGCIKLVECLEINIHKFNKFSIP